MGHAPGHPQHDCPPCKIIIDGRVFGEAVHGLNGLVIAAEQVAPRFLTMEALNALPKDEQDEMHAYSELLCHRAAEIRKWTEEYRLWLTSLTGGEYHGGWTVNGTEGITKKP